MKAQKGFTLIELMIVIAIIGILAAIAIPQYQNYIARSQVTRVMGETSSVKTAIEDCVLNGKAAADCHIGWTKSNLIAGADAAVGTAAKPGQDGLIITYPTNTTAGSIEATFGNNAAAILATKKLTWSRDTAGTWTCSTNVDDKFRPTGCAAATAAKKDS